MSTVVRLCCPQCFPLTHTDTQRQVGVHAEPQTHTWAEAGRGVNTARIWFRLKTCLIQTLRLYFPLSYLLTHTDVNTHTYTGTQTCSSDLLRFTMATSRGTTLCCSGIIIFGGGGRLQDHFGIFFFCPSAESQVWFPVKLPSKSLRARQCSARQLTASSISGKVQTWLWTVCMWLD